VLRWQQSDERDLDDDCHAKRRKTPNANVLRLAQELQGDPDTDEEMDIEQNDDQQDSDGGGSAVGNSEDGHVVQSSNRQNQVVVQSHGGKCHTQPPQAHQLGFYDAVTSTVLQEACQRFMMGIAAGNAYPSGKVLTDLEETAWRAATLQA
jgi:hypothetical protein